MKNLIELLKSLILANLIILVISIIALGAALVFAGQAGAEERTIFDSKYITYPREIYEKYCGHHLTAGGHWDCLDTLDLYGIPRMGCSDPVYKWAKFDQIAAMYRSGWEVAPLNDYEKVINRPYAPGVYWFYKCL